MTAAPSDLLAAVELSPRAAAAHDRAGWVGLFAADGRVEDPVGSRPHIGAAQIGPFYDTFIGPRDIVFHRDLDIVCGSTVVRDLELEVAMGPAVTMHIPAILRYDLRDDAGEWKLTRLRAYWELPAMMLQFLSTGSRAVSPALRLTRGLLSNQRLRGTAGFLTGFRRVGAGRKKLAEEFLRAAGRRDHGAAGRALSPRATITLGDHEQLDLADLADQLDGARPTKTISAGPTVTISVDSRRGRGMLFADMGRRGATINRVRYFPG